MHFTPIWIVTFCVFCVCSLAIIFLAKFTTKPVDSYNFSFKRVFPFEVIKDNEKIVTIYRILLCVFVAASFAPLFNLLTNYGQIANVQGLFKNSTNLSEVDISGWDSTNITSSPIFLIS